MSNNDDFMKDLQSSLAEEVNDELGSEGDSNRMAGSKKNKKKNKHTGLKVFLGILIAITACAAFLVLTPMGRRVLVGWMAEYAYSVIDKNNNEINTASAGSSFADDGLNGADISQATTNIDESQMSDTYRNAMHEDGVYNILLLGVEAIDSSEESGHTDSVMVFTINTNTNELGLTSIMRDTYVSVPGEQYYDTRINGVYRQGGIELMYETIAENFGLKLDGCAIVGFEAFQKVVDAVGGIDIKLTKEEAHYLNHTNYISEKKYRIMKTGWNHMNGNQALGYCRIRKIATLHGTKDDQGRTARHRRVINAIYKKVKKDPTKVIGVMNNVLPLVKTDIRKQNATAYMAGVLELALAGKTLDQLRLPEGQPDGTEYKYSVINGADMVEVTDWPTLKTNFLNFVFNPHPVKTSGTTMTSSGNVTSD